MSVRAKFRVNSITTSESTRWEKGPDGKQVSVPCELKTVKLYPVYGNGDPSHENTKFWNATPSGSVELGCVNAEAAAQFEVGKEYYVDFSAPAVVGA